MAILAAMLFMSGAGIGWLCARSPGVVAVAPIAINALPDYQRQRLFCFLDPYADPQGACYQLVQALNAVGSGGLLGQGLTAGRQNQLGFLPVQSTDFIFTVVGEELGLVGGLLLLGLFALLVWRILRIGWQARDTLGSLVAAGLAGMILVPGARERRHGHRHHARDRDPAAVHHIRWLVAHLAAVWDGDPRVGAHALAQADLLGGRAAASVFGGPRRAAPSSSA